MKKHIERKALHFLFGVFIVLLMISNFYVELILFVLLIFGIVMSFVLNKFKIPILSFLVHKLSKKNEFPGQGLVIFNLSALIVYLIFPVKIAIASIIILSIIDPIGLLIGLKYGKIKVPFNKNKHIEGRIIGAILCTIILSFMFNFIAALITSIFAIIFESLDVNIKKHKVDDNLTVPLISAIVLYILLVLL